MGLFKNIFCGIRNFLTEPYATNNEKTELYMNEQFINYQNNKKLKDVCIEFLEKNYLINIRSLELGFIPFNYQSESYVDKRPERLTRKYLYSKDKGLYSFYAQQFSNDIIKEQDFYIKDAIVGFHNKYIYRHDNKNLKVVKTFFNALNSQDILNDNQDNAYYVFIFYLYNLKRELLKENFFDEVDLESIKDEYDLIYEILYTIVEDKNNDETVYAYEIYEAASLICSINDNNELISKFELKNREKLRNLLNFHINEQNLNDLGVSTTVTKEYKELVDELEISNIINSLKKKKLEIKQKEDLDRQRKEKALSDEVKKIRENLKKGICPIDYSKIWLCNGYKNTDEFKQEYIKNIDLVCDELEKNFELFNKYRNNEQINLILKNFLVENKDISDFGSFNPFILNSCYFGDIKQYDNDGYFFDVGLLIKNALNKYMMINADVTEIENNIKFTKETETYGQVSIEKLSYKDIEHETYIQILRNAYKSMSYSQTSKTDEETTFILPYMCDSLRKNFEYVSELPFDIYQLAIHLFINGYDWNYEIESKEEKLAFKYLKEMYERIECYYKPVLLLKKGLLNKFKDLNNSVVYSLIQYKLNELRLEKVKEIFSNLEDIEYGGGGLYIIGDNEKSNKNIEYFYNNKYKLDEVIKIDKLLNHATLGNELIELIEVDEEFNKVNENKEYQYLINKYDELKSMDYVNRLSDANYKVSNKILIEDIDLMNGYEFEKFISKLFQKMGYKAYATQESNDQGVDVIAEKGNVKVAIQTKCYNGTVGNSAIQEIVAGMKYYEATKAMVITNSTFTKSAIELAKKNNVQLWDRKTLIEKINEVM